MTRVFNWNSLHRATANAMATDKRPLQHRPAHEQPHNVHKLRQSILAESVRRQYRCDECRSTVGHLHLRGDKLICVNCRDAR